MSNREERTYPCCVCCEGIAKGDHVEHGGDIVKDQHDSPCEQHQSNTSARGIAVPDPSGERNTVALRKEIDRLTDLIEEWRKHPAITLDDDGSAHVDLTKVEGRDQARIAQYRTRTWDAEHAIERVRALHVRVEPSGERHPVAGHQPFCGNCDLPWPCGTIRELDEKQP